jgi:succinate dehydrogenase hydrophobic anchor subunit
MMQSHLTSQKPKHVPGIILCFFFFFYFYFVHISIGLKFWDIFTFLDSETNLLLDSMFMLSDFGIKV